MAKDSAKTKVPYFFVKSLTIPSTGTTMQIGQVDLQASGFDKVGLRLQSVEYFLLTDSFEEANIAGIITALAASGDSIAFGFKSSSGVENAGEPENIGMIDVNTVARKDFGTAANGVLLIDPMITKDFTKINPGGILVHPSALYMWLDARNAFTEPSGYATKIRAKVCYYLEQLDDSAYQELLNSVLISRVV